MGHGTMGITPPCPAQPVRLKHFTLWRLRRSLLVKLRWQRAQEYGLVPESVINELLVSSKSWRFALTLAHMPAQVGGTLVCFGTILAGYSALGVSFRRKPAARCLDKGGSCVHGSVDEGFCIDGSVGGWRQPLSRVLINAHQAHLCRA